MNHRHKKSRPVQAAAAVPQEPAEPARGAAPGSSNQGCGKLFGGRWATMAWSLLSGLVLWMSFPPLGWWPLAWVAPVGWLVLIRGDRLPGRWPYAAVMLASLLHWLAVLEGIRLAHPALYLGWFALAGYLAVYPVLFVALTRVAVHQCRISVVVAAPVVWTGLEWVRGHAITGFSMALLGHTQIHQTRLLQIADVFGAYGISFLVMLMAALLARMLPIPTRTALLSVRFSGLRSWRVRLVPRLTRTAPPSKAPWTWWPVVLMFVVFAAVLGYGQWRLRPSDRPPVSLAPLRVALIQGSFDTIFEYNPERDRNIFLRYRQLSEQAVASHPDVQLVVWPESMFSGDLAEILIDEPLELPPAPPLPAEEYRLRIRSRAEAFRYKVEDTVRRLNSGRGTRQTAPGAGVAMIVGTDTLHLTPDATQRFNAALCFSPTGQIIGRYYKMHRVMFGEYIPWGDRFPSLYRLTPMTQGLTPGTSPTSFRIAGWNLAPSICFESTVPHLIRQHVTELQRSGNPPDALVNVTNDGWFWGSAILDLQLACAVFRAIESRLPVLVAANTGISAVIDSDGRIQQTGLRQGEAVLYAEIRSDNRPSWYYGIGDLPAGFCGVFCLLIAIFALATGRLWNKAGETGR